MGSMKDDTMGSVNVPDQPEFVPPGKAITVTKDNGTKVSYYIFPEFELHDNVLAPDSIQGWHYHQDIEEIIFVTEGSIEVLWLDKDKKKQSKILRSGDLCRLGRSVHTVANRTKEPARFLVYRLVSREKNQHQLIKNDRYPVDVA
jgi:quercetin dioxygenase-like cupin family protein